MPSPSVPDDLQQPAAAAIGFAGNGSLVDSAGLRTVVLLKVQRYEIERSGQDRGPDGNIGVTVTPKCDGVRRSTHMLKWTMVPRRLADPQPGKSILGGTRANFSNLLAAKLHLEQPRKPRDVRNVAIASDIEASPSDRCEEKEAG